MLPDKVSITDYILGSRFYVLGPLAPSHSCRTLGGGPRWKEFLLYPQLLRYLCRSVSVLKHFTPRLQPVSSDRWGFSVTGCSCVIKKRLYSRACLSRTWFLIWQALWLFPFLAGGVSSRAEVASLPGVKCLVECLWRSLQIAELPELCCGPVPFSLFHLKTYNMCHAFPSSGLTFTFCSCYNVSRYWQNT